MTDFILIVTCAGCDEPTKHLFLTNGKPYCKRCFDEIVSLRKQKRVRRKGITLLRCNRKCLLRTAQRK